MLSGAKNETPTSDRSPIGRCFFLPGNVFQSRTVTAVYG